MKSFQVDFSSNYDATLRWWLDSHERVTAASQRQSAMVPLLRCTAHFQREVSGRRAYSSSKGLPQPSSMGAMVKFKHLPVWNIPVKNRIWLKNKNSLTNLHSAICLSRWITNDNDINWRTLFLCCNKICSMKLNSLCNSPSLSFPGVLGDLRPLSHARQAYCTDVNICWKCHWNSAKPLLSMCPADIMSGTVRGTFLCDPKPSKPPCGLSEYCFPYKLPNSFNSSCNWHKQNRVFRENIYREYIIYDSKTTDDELVALNILSTVEPLLLMIWCTVLSFLELPTIFKLSLT